jgi:hypothetical protein
MANHSAALPAYVDLGNGPVKPGWIWMEGIDGQDGIVYSAGITYTASCYLDYEEQWSDRSGGDIGNDYLWCDEECGGPEGSIMLTISDLTPGVYQLTSFHNNAAQGYRCPLNITVTGSDVVAATTDTNVPVTENTVDDDIGTGFVRFVTAGSADVNVYFTPNCSTWPGCTPHLNGFILNVSTLAVQFDSASSYDFETVSPVVLTVSLTEPATEPIAVDYTVTGTAEGNGVDYTHFGDGTLTFDPCETTKTITFAIIDDGLKEPDETIVVTLSDVSGACAQLGEMTQYTYTIISEGTVGLEGTYYCRLNSGEPWEPAAKVGPHADITVRFDDANNQFVFRRASSYLPYWQTKFGKWYVSEVVPRSGDGTGLMHDKINQYSRVHVIENTPARAVVHWRYVPNFTNCDWDGWVEEYFTVYPDGICIRTIKNAKYTTLSQWQDPNNITIQKLMLLPGGIWPLPALWQTIPDLSLSAASLTKYNDAGFNESKRCYLLECKNNGVPADLTFTLGTTGQQLIHNPAILIKNWGHAGLYMTLDGQTFRNYYAGYVPQMNGTNLIVWLEVESEDAVEVSISPRGTGPAIVRAPVPDPYTHNPPVFPEGSADPGPFGAYYTHLKYSSAYDLPWRVGDHTDVVVQFDDSTDRFIFWRGTNYIPHWANDLNHWYDNQFVERRGDDAGLEGCCEPMQDYECRYSHARIIHSHPARAVVHWRYAPNDKYYRHPYVDGTGWGDWVDEYYTIYPDRIATRKVKVYTSAPWNFMEWHEAIPLVGAGTIPEENVHWEALSLTDMSGHKVDYSWESGWPTEHFADGRNIMIVRTRGATMPFVVVENKNVWVDECGHSDNWPLNHYDDWPAWPYSYIGSDWDICPETGYREFWHILASHSSLLHLVWGDYAQELGALISRTRVMLHGMTTDWEVNALIPIARSWEQPPTLRIDSPGYSGGAYDKTERAYRISRTEQDPNALALSLLGSYNCPIINACFVIENWWGEDRAALNINGQDIAPGPDFRQGIEKTADGASSLVVWIGKELTSPITAIRRPRHLHISLARKRSGRVSAARRRPHRRRQRQFCRLRPLRRSLANRHAVASGAGVRRSSLVFRIAYSLLRIA